MFDTKSGLVVLTLAMFSYLVFDRSAHNTAMTNQEAAHNTAMTQLVAKLDTKIDLMHELHSNS